MSGGRFDYRQYVIDEIACDVDEYVNGRDLDDDEVRDITNDRWTDDTERQYVKEHKRTMPNYNDYSEATIAEFRKGIDILRKAYIYAQRIDWLLSGDDGEEQFHERLKENLAKLEQNN